MNKFRITQNILGSIIFLTTLSLQSQSLTFGPTTTLYTLDGAHWTLSQPMIPTVSIDGKHVDFYGLTGSTYKKHSYTAGSYPSKSFASASLQLVPKLP